MMMTGLIALFAQNLADLGLEVPALAIAAVLTLAAGERTPGSPADQSTTRLGRLALATLAPALALLAATFTWARDPVDVERGEVAVAYRELALQSTTELAQFRSELRRAVLRHPGEAYFPLLGALVAVRTGDESALRWIARALELEPMSGRVHLALAEVLHAHGAVSQSMLHLRLAAQYDRTLIGLAGARASLWAPSLDVLMQAIPDGPYGERMLLEACDKQTQLERRIDCSRRTALAHRPLSCSAAGVRGVFVARDSGWKLAVQ